MIEIRDLNVQYHSILTQLVLLNPKFKLDEIKNDIEEFLYNSFIGEIGSRTFSREISYEKIRRNIIKQKLQSSRQPSQLRDVKDDKIKKKTKQFRLKKIQSSLNRKAFYDALDYPGSFSKKELFYINHTNKTFHKNEFPDIDKNENQELLYSLKELTSNKKVEINVFNENDVEVKNEFPELQETIDIFKRVAEKEEHQIKEDIEILDLEQELRNRILNLDLKPIAKEKSEPINLLDYIGFVDKNEDSKDD